MARSIVQYFPEQSCSNCGYCLGKDSSVTTGMWAHVLTVEDYQGLIYRNWRRSGSYCYHPEMDKTCCPAYMIRCDVNAFKLGKHHKKNIKRFNRFLMTGEVSAVATSSDTPGNSMDTRSSAAGQSAAGQSNSIQSVNAGVKVKQVSQGAGADPSKPKPIKAKLARQQRKQDKLNTQARVGSVQPSSGTKSNNQEKSLHDFLTEYDPANAKHKFELKLVQSHPESPEFARTKEEEYQIYKKYQVAVHKDPESKVPMKQFKRFLIDSPLEEETRGGVKLGSFHYQYILDGKIIAVEVMDILPETISSKYFFYDPQYEFLTLGVYSTFRSIYFIQQLQLKLPSIKYYLMGYYIHSCQKMRYKANFSHSYLICPETYQWVPVERCVPKLDVDKYSRLCDDPFQEDVDLPGDSDHTGTLCLFNRQIVPYGLLQALLHSRDDEQAVKRYTRLVGTKLSKTILIYREMPE